jgi:GNAT superfamily N-acetyltransferase
MIEIRPSSEADVATIVDLLEDLERFYGTTDFPDRNLRERQVTTLLFGPLPAARVLLAHDDEHAVGLASYSLLWPAAGVTASLYLKELYVQSSHRGRGIGRRLMARVCAIAADTGCSRVEWTTDRDNAAALAFYERLGAPANTAKVMYRVDGADVARLAGLTDPTAAGTHSRYEL